MGTSDIIARFISTIERHAMLGIGDTLLTGLSGGPDSVCLLHLLNIVKEKFRLSIHAVYVNHNLRPHEIPLEIKFCRMLCKKLALNFILKSVDVTSYQKAEGINRQEAARELRYMAFEEAVFEVNATKICLAHNADDQAETVFMRLIRGSGPKGLSGIPVKRGRIIRPLIEIERSAIDNFLESNRFDYVVDSSNLKEDYLRNRMRLSIIPEFKKLNPNLLDSIRSTTLILQEEERYFEILVTKTLMKLISRKSASRIELFLSPLEMMEKVLLRRVLRRAIDETKGVRGIGFGHIEDIISLIKGGKAGDRLYLPKGIRVIKEYAILTITSDTPVKISDYELHAGDEVTVVGAGIVIKASLEEEDIAPGNGKSSVLLDADTITLPLRIRARQPGDFFYPHGFGKRKKLQDFFVDQKIPRDERDSVPLLLSGSDIVFVAGYRADERFRPGPDTKNFLRLVIVKGKF